MPLDRRDLRRRLYRLAAGQSGYFTASQAKGIGYSHQAQKYHVDAGNWTRVDRGLFRLPEWPVGERDDLVRWHLWSDGRAVASHETALALHGLGQSNPARIHLTVPASFRRRVPAGLVVHRGEVDDEDVVEYEGFRATKALRTILDVAALAGSQEALDEAVADALDQGVVTRRQLLARADGFGAAAALGVERALRKADER